MRKLRNGLFEGANGETVRRIGDGSPTGEAEDKISPVSLLQTVRWMEEQN